MNFHALQQPNVLNLVIIQETTQGFTMSNSRWKPKNKKESERAGA
jgi:hypothetical protein